MMVTIQNFGSYLEQILSEMVGRYLNWSQFEAVVNRGSTVYVLAECVATAYT